MDEFYKILELKPGASIEEIKAARKELLQVWHPDRFQHHPKLAAKALQRSKEINEAYEKLVDFFTSGRAYERATTSRPSRQGDSSRSTKRRSEENSAKDHRTTMPMIPFNVTPHRKHVRCRSCLGH